MAILMIAISFSMGFIIWTVLLTIDGYKMKKNPFKIRHFPLSGLYYPMYKGYYMKRDGVNGIIHTEDYLPVADGFQEKEYAERFIELFKEQQLMKNVEDLNYE